MAKGVNKVFLLGHVGQDPDIKSSANGGNVVTGSLATNDWSPNGEVVQWHRWVAFGKVADVIKDYVKKGDKIHIEGGLRYGKYTGKDGVERNTTDIIIRDVTLLGGGNNPKPAAQETTQQKEYTPPPSDDDDLPF